MFNMQVRNISKNNASDAISTNEQCLCERLSFQNCFKNTYVNEDHMLQPGK